MTERTDQRRHTSVVHRALAYGMSLVCGLCLVLCCVSAPRAELQDVTFGSVQVRWSDTIAGATMDNVALLSASVFSGNANENAFAAAVRRVLVTLESDGYREARIRPGDFSSHGASLDFTLHITPGPRSRVIGYGFCSLVHTDTVWLKRLVAQPVGVPLTADWLRIATARLARLSSIRINAEPEIMTVEANPENKETSVIVRWSLEENRNARLDGVLAAGGEGDQSGLTGRAAMQFDGLFGRDRSIAVRYNRSRPQWNSLSVRFAERGAFGGPLGWAFELDESNQRDRRQRVAARVGYSLGRSASWALGAAASWHRVTPGDNIAAPSRILDASLGIEKPLRPITRAGAAEAHGGLWTTLSHRRVFGRAADNTATDRLRLDAQAGITHIMADRWEFSVASMARTWISGRDGLSFGDEWFLGGADHLRGYDDQTFSAASGIWGLAEIGYRLIPSLGLSLFGEAARFREVESSGHTATVQLPIDYGGALRLMSAGRIGRLEFAWRRDAGLRDGFVRLRVTQSW